jgi:hypothetical protein
METPSSQTAVRFKSGTRDEHSPGPPCSYILQNVGTKFSAVPP